MSFRFIIIISLSVILFGCSNRQIYEAVQNNRKNECRKLPYPQQEDCIKAHGASYEEYSRKREEAIKD